VAVVSGVTKIVTSVQAPQVYAFDTPAQSQQFDYLTHAMRCLVCQNEPLADSQATLAQDFRTEIATQIKQHKSNDAIIQYFTSRYGDHVLYNPPLNVETGLLWILPFVFAVLAIGILWRQIVRQRKRVSC
jgi:cytochrome c-type biogenesis protein CcmH